MAASSMAQVGGEVAVNRDNHWLGEHLAQVWDRYFPDTPCRNPVDIAFAKRWKARLGLISLCEASSVSRIRLNLLLSFPEVPESVTTITIAHEMVHYAHGFGSSLPRRHEHPHRGNVVENEIVRRGLGPQYGEYLDWIDRHWDQFYHTRSVPPRHLWLARRSGDAVRVVGEGMYAHDAAASVIRLRTAVPTASELALPG